MPRRRGEQLEHRDPPTIVGRAHRVSYIRYFLVALAAAAAWSCIGAIVAWFEGGLSSFVAQWRATQGFFLICIGIWLLLISRSGALEDRLGRAIKAGQELPRGVANQPLRIGVIVTVAAIGTASFVGMGFDAKGLTLVFLWLTAGLICLLAGVLTLHTLDLLLNERCRERRCRPCWGHRDTASHLNSWSRTLTCLLPCFSWCRRESASESYVGLELKTCPLTRAQ